MEKKIKNILRSYKKIIMKIHKEGYKVIPIATLLIVFICFFIYQLISLEWIQWSLGISAFIFWVLIVRFFRNPKVITEPIKNLVYAPADGKIVAINKVFEPEYHKEERIQLSVFMSPLNVHVNRSPIEGIIDFFKYHPGKFLVAWHPKSSLLNERTSIGLKTSTGTTILMRQIAGTVARRIAFYLKTGEKVTQGQSLGFIRFGSRVDVFLPLDVSIKVKIGDKTKAGITQLAQLKE